MIKRVFFYLERLSKLLGSSFCRLSSSIILTTSAAAGQVLAIFCKSAIVVLVLNNPTARRFNPCKRHASTAAKVIFEYKKFNQNINFYIHTTKCCYTTIFFMNTFFHYCFFHHLFYLEYKCIDIRNKLILFY